MPKNAPPLPHLVKKVIFGLNTMSSGKAQNWPVEYVLGIQPLVFSQCCSWSEHPVRHISDMREKGKKEEQNSSYFLVMLERTDI